MAHYDLPGKTILMHNRCGIRIELNFDRQGLLELWISPRAGRSRLYRDRNFSCRDDHTRVFDSITMPGLGAERFRSCDYDPFHSTLLFDGQRLDVVTLYDRPAVLLRFSAPQTVDLKSDKQDRCLVRTARAFTVSHPDRGETFEFAAAVSSGAGRFQHQEVVDRGRSTYSRVTLAAGQCLAIGAGLSGEGVMGLARQCAAAPWRTLVASNEKQISGALGPGRFRLRSHPRLQRLLDTSRRVLLAMQDKSGAIRAALNRIYYLIWVRDGAIIECYNAAAGNAGALNEWTRFLLANPTTVRVRGYRGRMFGQLVNPITKWQEDGTFYAVWCAFNCWQRGGDQTMRDPATLSVLRDSIAWLERYCFDRNLGLFGRYYACETPLPGSHDDGVDGAVGEFTEPSWVMFRGQPVRRSYDVYVNLYMYAAYAMMAALDRARVHRYLSKMQRIGESLERLLCGTRPDYGLVRTGRGSLATAPAYGLDDTDYIWGLTVPEFNPCPWRMPDIRKRLLLDALRTKKRYFLASYFSICSSLDTLHVPESLVMRAVLTAARQCYRPGQMLPMPNTVVEMLNVPDGDWSHDVRPQAFSIGPWLATMVGLGVRRLPFGFAFRPCSILASVSGYQYGRHLVSVRFGGHGHACRVTLNGKVLRCTLQVPLEMLRNGQNMALVMATARWPAGPLLVASTVELRRVRQVRGAVCYHVCAYGANSVEFLGRPTLRVRSLSGRAIDSEVHYKGGFTWVTFRGVGRFVIEARQ